MKIDKFREQNVRNSGREMLKTTVDAYIKS